jgi:hypothetical protein
VRGLRKAGRSGRPAKLIPGQLREARAFSAEWAQCRRGLKSLATDAAPIAAIMATTAPSGRVSMRSWLHSRMCRRATLPRHAQMSAKLKRISMKPYRGAQARILPD